MVRQENLSITINRQVKESLHPYLSCMYNRKQYLASYQAEYFHQIGCEFLTYQEKKHQLAHDKDFFRLPERFQLAEKRRRINREKCMY